MFLIFDWETTGLTNHPSASTQPKPIEFGGVLLDASGVEVESLGALVHPGEPITEEITKITGITNQMLDGQPTFAEFLPQLRAFFSKAEVMIAHNLPFDRQILLSALERNGVADFPWPKRSFCTVQLYAEEFGYGPRLIQLYEAKLGKPLAQTHRATDDCRALAEVFVSERLWEVL